MFSHVMLGANDIQESKSFYDATLEVLGYKPGVIDEKGRCFYFNKTGTFALSLPIDGKPASKGNGSTVGFSAKSTKDVDDWHAVGTANGGMTCEDPPGVREATGMKLYLAYLLDPSGNKICALHRMA
jgi:catechol 2,3-dioxygenase-like lactoylglutathione lyase family enzyme